MRLVKLTDAERAWLDATYEGIGSGYDKLEDHLAQQAQRIAELEASVAALNASLSEAYSLHSAQCARATALEAENARLLANQESMTAGGRVGTDSPRPEQSGDRCCERGTFSEPHDCAKSPPYETAPRLTKGARYRVVEHSPVHELSVGEIYVARGYEQSGSRNGSVAPPGEGWYSFPFAGWYRVVRVEPEKREICPECCGEKRVYDMRSGEDRGACPDCKGTGEKQPKEKP